MIQLREEDIILELEAKNKDNALRELAETLHKHCPGIEIEDLLTALREREQIGSTGVGHGVALPHAKFSRLDRMLICFARSACGIAFDAADNQPVHLLVMLLAPTTVVGEYMRTLAGLRRLLKEPELRKHLRAAQTRQEVIDIFGKAE